MRTHANVVGGGLLCSDEQHLELGLDINGRSFYCEETKDIPNRESKTDKETANTVEPFSIMTGLKGVSRRASIAPVLDDCTPLKIIRSHAKQYDVTRVKQDL